MIPRNSRLLVHSFTACRIRSLHDTSYWRPPLMKFRLYILYHFKKVMKRFILREGGGYMSNQENIRLTSLSTKGG